jgi:hypothetical protein
MRELPPAMHRPWPLPSDPWIMFQSWQKLLFAHWPLEPAALRRLIPAQLEIDTRDDSAWIGITPFLMRDLRPRGVPPLPLVSDFLELNVRTYVRHEDRPGVWFFTLETDSRVAAAAARFMYSLPYHVAEMTARVQDGWVDYRSARAAGEVAARYRGLGPATPAQPGTLAHFLTERYALYSRRSSRLYRGEIHHAPWSLQDAEGEVTLLSLVEGLGLPLPAGAPLLHYSERQDTFVWAPHRIV